MIQITRGGRIVTCGMTHARRRSPATHRRGAHVSPSRPAPTHAPNLAAARGDGGGPLTTWRWFVALGVPVAVAHAYGRAMGLDNRQAVGAGLVPAHITAKAFSPAWMRVRRRSEVVERGRAQSGFRRSRGGSEAVVPEPHKLLAWQPRARPWVARCRCGWVGAPCRFQYEARASHRHHRDGLPGTGDDAALDRERR